MRKIYSLLLLFFYFYCNCQNAGDVYQNFGALAPAFNLDVQIICPQPDGKVIVGGKFTTYEGIPENRIIRLNSNGKKDVAFNTGTGFNNNVNVIIIQPDEKIIIGGNFTSYNGTTENRIIRLNSDGSKDNTFNIGTGFNSSVESLVLQPDGKIIVGGFFTLFNGIGQNRIIRLNSDGSKDVNFIINNGFNSGVQSIALQNNGKVVVGGVFSEYNGVSENNIIRLNSDGDKDSTFVVDTGFNNLVSTIVIQNDGKIILGGDFTSFNGFTENRIVRLNNNGTRDNSFSTGTGFSDRINSIIIESNGKIYVGGNFTSYNDVSQNKMISLNEDGSKNLNFNISIGFNNNIKSLAFQPNGKIITGGLFSSYNLINENYIISLNTDGTKDLTFMSTSGFNGYVGSLALQSDGKFLVSVGSFNQVLLNSVIRFHTDGTIDSTFNTNISGNLTIQSDGKIIVSGNFTSFNGVSQNRIIRLNSDGTKDPSFNIGIGFDGLVNTVVVQPDGKIIVGGQFTSYNGIAASNIIRLNNDGTDDTTFNTGTGFDVWVGPILLQPDGKIIVGGPFNSYNGTTENRIVRLNSDGTKDTSFITGVGFNTQVIKLSLQSDGKILVGGNFFTYNGENGRCLVRLNNNGSRDNTFNTGSGFEWSVNAIDLKSDGKIIIGGAFSSYNGVSNINNFVCLNTDGSIDNNFNSGTGFNGTIFSILNFNDKIYVAGSFTTYKDIGASAYLITLYGNSQNLSNQKHEIENDIIIWPNPTQDYLNFNISNDEIKNVKIYNLQGKLLFESKKSDIKIDVSNLESGLYFITVQTEKGEFSKKFLKK